MIHLLLSILAAVVLVVIFTPVLHLPLWLSIFLGLVGGVALFIYLSRRVQGELEKLFTRAAELLKKQQFDPAIEVMKEGYRYNLRQFMIKGAIDGQIGVIQFLRKKEAEAEPLLRSASSSHYVAKSMLGVLQWKRGEKAAVHATFQRAIKSGKKESLVYAVYAYLLVEMKDRQKAIEILSKGLTFCKGDERLKANLTLLQNNKPMKMKVYGEQWYQFMLERPMMRQEAPPYMRTSMRGAHR